MKQIPTCLKGMAAVLTVIAMTMVLTPAGLMAQDVAVGTATATVLAALQVTAGQALDFGNVYQGVAKSVAKNDASAGVFTIAGQSLSQVSIYMQMPEFMATASGDDRMSSGVWYSGRPRRHDGQRGAEHAGSRVSQCESAELPDGDPSTS